MTLAVERDVKQQINLNVSKEILGVAPIQDVNAKILSSMAFDILFKSHWNDHCEETCKQEWQF